jgi:hypothetical protein
MGIPKSTAPPLGDDTFSARSREVCDELFALHVLDNRSDGDGDAHRLTACALHVLPATVLSAFGLEMPAVTIVHEGSHPGIGKESDIAAPAAIPPIGASARDVLLPSKTHAAVTTVAGLDLNFGFINKLHILLTGRVLPPTKSFI